LPGYIRFKDLKYTVAAPKSRVNYSHRTVEERGKKVGAGVDGYVAVQRFAHDYGADKNEKSRLKKTEVMD
jgi:hypothetical protein